MVAVGHSRSDLIAIDPLDDAGHPARVVFFCSAACKARPGRSGKGGRANAPKKPSYVMSIKFNTLTAG